MSPLFRRRAETEALIAETERMRERLAELSTQLDEYVHALQAEIERQQEMRSAQK